MYDGGKIVTGLVIFLALVTLPVWYGVASGKGAAAPEPEIITQAKQCVEPTPYMRTKHSELLNNWKNSVVREGQRTYLASDGRQFDISLTNTCLDCHSNKAQFCDTCHTYTGVEPNCWQCHAVPQEKTQ